MGLGLHQDQLDGETIEEYLDWIETPMADHEDVLWPDNNAFFDILEQTIESVSSRFGSRAFQTPWWRRRFALRQSYAGVQ